MASYSIEENILTTLYWQWKDLYAMVLIYYKTICVCKCVFKKREYVYVYVSMYQCILTAYLGNKRSCECFNFLIFWLSQIFLLLTPDINADTH